MLLNKINNKQQLLKGESMKKFKLFISAVIIATLLISSIVMVIAAESHHSALSDTYCDTCCHDHNYNTQDIIFDWAEYQELIEHITLDIRIPYELESDIKVIVIAKLLLDGILPENTFNSAYYDAVNENILYDFIDNNVTIEFFESIGNTRQITCCHQMVLVWEVFSRWRSGNANNWCQLHCEFWIRVCITCRAIHVANHKVSSRGCGHHVLATGGGPPPPQRCTFGGTGALCRCHPVR